MTQSYRRIRGVAVRETEHHRQSNTRTFTKFESELFLKFNHTLCKIPQIRRIVVHAMVVVGVVWGVEYWLIKVPGALIFIQ